MDFLDWTMMASCTGAFAMVLVITQFTKGLKWIDKLPTQLWSYLVSLAVLYAAYFFTGQLSASNAVLILFNGMIVALASNGGFEVLNKVFPGLFK